jgi:hypothetical protein
LSLCEAVISCMITALSLTAAIGPIAANAAEFGMPQSSLFQHQGPYDNTAHGRASQVLKVVAANSFLSSKSQFGRATGFFAV